MDINKFILINGLVGFFSDIILNGLSNYKLMNLNTLRPYFNHHSIVGAATLASITVVIVVYIICFVYKLLYDKYLPETNREIIVFIILTFIIGYIADILIHRLNIFPKLKLYYKVVGGGLWGGLAITFSVILSYLILYNINDEQ